MLKPFRISNLYSKSANLVDWSGIVQLSSVQYDEELELAPDFALTYLDDEDDGEIITVGSSFELGQRLLESPREAQVSAGHVPADDPSILHVFDLQQLDHAVNPWSKYTIQYGPPAAPNRPSAAAPSQHERDEYQILLARFNVLELEARFLREGFNVLELEVKWLKDAFKGHAIPPPTRLYEPQEGGFPSRDNGSDSSTRPSSSPSRSAALAAKPDTGSDIPTHPANDPGSTTRPTREMSSRKSEKSMADAVPKGHHSTSPRSHRLENLPGSGQHPDLTLSRAEDDPLWHECFGGGRTRPILTDKDVCKKPETLDGGAAPSKAAPWDEARRKGPRSGMAPISPLLHGTALWAMPDTSVMPEVFDRVKTAAKKTVWEGAQKAGPHLSMPPISPLLRGDAPSAGQDESARLESFDEIKRLCKKAAEEAAAIRTWPLPGIHPISSLPCRVIDSDGIQTATETASSRQATPGSLLDLEPEAEIARFPTIFQLEEEGRRSAESKPHPTLDLSKSALFVARAKTVPSRMAAARLLKPFDPAAEGFRLPFTQSPLPNRQQPLAKPSHDTATRTLWQGFERSERPAPRRCDSSGARLGLPLNVMPLHHCPSISRPQSLNRPEKPSQPRQNGQTAAGGVAQPRPDGLSGECRLDHGRKDDKTVDARPERVSLPAARRRHALVLPPPHSVYQLNQGPPLCPDRQATTASATHLPRSRPQEASQPSQSQAALEFLSDARFIPAHASQLHVPAPDADPHHMRRIADCVRALQKSGYEPTSRLNVYAEVCDGDLSKAKTMADEDFRATQGHTLTDDDDDDDDDDDNNNDDERVVSSCLKRLVEMGYGAAHRQVDLYQLALESNGRVELAVETLARRATWDGADWARWRLETPQH